MTVFPRALFAFQIDAKEESAIGAKLLGAQRLAIRQVVIEEGLLAMQALQRRVRGFCLAPHEPDLIERLTGSHLDGKRAWHNFEKQRSFVAGPDLIEPGVQIRHDAGEHVQSSCRALGVGPRPKGRRKTQRLQERHQIDVTFFENRPPGQIHLVHHEVGLIKVHDVEAAGDGRKLRQKTADQSIGFLSEPQVEARRLDLSVFNRKRVP